MSKFSETGRFLDSSEYLPVGNLEYSYPEGSEPVGIAWTRGELAGEGLEELPSLEGVWQDISKDIERAYFALVAKDFFNDYGRDGLGSVLAHLAQKHYTFVLTSPVYSGVTGNVRRAFSGRLNIWDSSQPIDLPHFRPTTIEEQREWAEYNPDESYMGYEPPTHEFVHGSKPTKESVELGEWYNSQGDSSEPSGRELEFFKELYPYVMEAISKNG